MNRRKITVLVGIIAGAAVIAGGGVLVGVKLVHQPRHIAAARITHHARAVTSPSPSLPPGVTAGPSPGTYYVDCSVNQCTTQPGAGPFGTTCTQPSTSEQFCGPDVTPQPSTTDTTDPNGVTCPFLDSTGYCPGDAPATTPPVLLNITVTPGCSYGGGYDASGNAIPDAFTANANCTPAELNNGDGVASSPVAGQMDAYQVTVTNNNSYAVSVSQVTIGYYDAQNNELDSTNQDLGIIQIAPGATVNQVYDYTGAPTGTVTVRATSWQ